MISEKEEGKVSVIVPVFNMSAYLERCVLSIMNQEYQNLEIVLVDDGSTDNSYAICQSLSVSDKRIKCVHKKNGGQGSARNMALDMCTGEYIMFVDSDDSIETNCVSLLLRNLLCYEADISCGLMYRKADKSDFCDGKNIEVYDNFEAMSLYVKNAKGIDLAPVVKLYRKSIFDGVRFLEISGYEDAGTMFRYFANAKRVVTQDSTLYYYFQRENSTMHRIFSKKDCDRIVAYREMERFFYNDKRYNELAIYATNSKIGAVYYVLGETLKNKLPEKNEIVDICREECRNTLKNKRPISIKNRLILHIIVSYPKLFGLMYKLSH